MLYVEVAGVVGRAELLCFLFSLAATWLYDRAVVTNSLLWALAAMLAVLLATVSKETGIAVIGIFW